MGVFEATVTSMGGARSNRPLSDSRRPGVFRRPLPVLLIGSGSPHRMHDGVGGNAAPHSMTYMFSGGWNVRQYQSFGFV